MTNAMDELEDLRTLAREVQEDLRHSTLPSVLILKALYGELEAFLNDGLVGQVARMLLEERFSAEHISVLMSHGFEQNFNMALLGSPVLTPILKNNDIHAWKTVVDLTMGEFAFKSAHQHAFAKTIMADYLVDFIEQHEQEREEMLQALTCHVKPHQWNTEISVHLPQGSGVVRYGDFMVFTLLQHKAPQTAQLIWNDLFESELLSLTLTLEDVLTWETLWAMSDETKQDYMRQHALDFQASNPCSTVVDRLPSLIKEDLLDQVPLGTHVALGRKM